MLFILILHVAFRFVLAVPPFFAEQHTSRDKKDQFSDQGRSYADKSVSRVIRVFVRPGLGRSSATTCAKLRRAGPEKCFSRLSRDLQGPRAGRAATGPANGPRSNECQS